MPKLPEVAGRFDGVAIGEQIVDSAVYRFDLLLRTYRKDAHKDILAGSSVSLRKLTTSMVTANLRAS